MAAIASIFLHSVEATAGLAIDLSNMRRLSRSQEQLNAKNDQVPVLVTFFQKDCGHCDRQLRELDCLALVGWRVIAVGIGLERLHLRRQWLRLSKKSEGYWINFDEAKEQKVFATPHNFVWAAGGQEGLRLSGVFSCEQLKSSVPPSIN